ncbi:39S ribosomal protein L55, mitochondrial-like [Microcaecilia unicolor]|uniref:39S ribosomal protein L55, mitochondrial n=1 Tax=Microcaecilia unicolor TaxID=1415580 RepID=A0A6P7XL31_9AMPH|nr:39S ribosomal protein L55, mitochondrial [Microcaecilia unicolor]XP_030053218.1 39S ribosomal protein L55, mitochondrial [Microcaecilia unicolor]XP_030053225.1 39S ribosomal protein L55, mitochondrial [Microcaecilia unicolor]XP_030053229.1 39S ribosomal protein L55, mitochondrial [Microcaecilia unicolor]XP_030053241.1 39S ribosomal protein L55, mitochondrial-like [Microcaecilia unicolor]
MVIARSGMATVSRTFSLLQQDVAKIILPAICNLHTSTGQQNSNRTSIVRFGRQTYARLYPVLLVRPDGSTINIRYKEPRRILMMPVDISTLPEAERKARLRKRDHKRLERRTDKEDFQDDFNADQYRKFWKKK